MPPHCPLPNKTPSHPQHYCIRCHRCIICCRGHHKALPIIFPTSPPPPPLFLLSSVIVLPNRSLDSFPRNASANSSGSLDMINPWSARRMTTARSAVSSPDDGHVRTLPPLALAALSLSSSSSSSSSSILLLHFLTLVVIFIVIVGPCNGIPRERATPPSGARTVPTRSTGVDDRSPSPPLPMTLLCRSCRH
jgi:hypothetical protein